jgi:hypothetical protein
MSENVVNLIDAIQAGKSLDIEQNFNQVMAEKLHSAIDQRREELSRHLLTTPEEVEQEIE